MKNISYLLIVVICLLAFSSCSEASNTEYTITDFDSISQVQIEIEQPTDTSAEGSIPNDETGDATFLVKDKKYTLNENDILLLDITNETEQNYSIKLTVTYYDDKGDELKTDEFSFEQFAAGYQNNFVFQPKIKFSKYTYAIKASPFAGEIIVDKFQFQFVELYETRMPLFDNETGFINENDFTEYPSILARFTFGSTHTEMKKLAFTMLLFNEQNELIGTYYNAYMIQPKSELGVECKTAVVYQTTENTLDWPERYQGNIRAVFCIGNFMSTDMPF